MATVALLAQAIATNLPTLTRNPHMIRLVYPAAGMRARARVCAHAFLRACAPNPQHGLMISLTQPEDTKSASPPLWVSQSYDASTPKARLAGSSHLAVPSLPDAATANCITYDDYTNVTTIYISSGQLPTQQQMGCILCNIEINNIVFTQLHGPTGCTPT